MPYDLQPMKAPRAAGGLLRLFASLLENPVTGGALTQKLLRDIGILALRETPLDDDVPLSARHPLLERFGRAGERPGAPIDLDALAAPRAAAGGSATFETAADVAAAYRDGRTTPEAIARRVLDAAARDDALDPPMRYFIAQDAEDVLAQARLSTERWQQGKPLGPLDGVPVAVKDEVDQHPYPTTVGTAFLGGQPAAADATVVARLRAAGALLVGKANMHEIGLGVTGLNPHHGSARNPYGPLHATGGSSSGSAAAVAAGLCPVAIGADGGGSIRIPAAFCGVVGLKATYGRVSEHGAAPLCWSVAHVGPIGATARDVALGYALIAGPDPHDPNSSLQPPPTLDGLLEGGLRGLRLGVYRPWFEDADPDVVASCTRMLDELAREGAEIVDVEIPDLRLLRALHLVTIVSEMAASHARYYPEHQKDYGVDVRLNLALARRLGGFDYVHAQRHRRRLSEVFYRVLEGVDGIVTPTTACTAPVLPADALKTGESNLAVLDRIMRYAHAANVTGLPAISFPAGYDRAGLPIGLQVLGRAWQEHVLLRIAVVAEALVERRPPKVHHQLLGGLA